MIHPNADTAPTPSLHLILADAQRRELARVTRPFPASASESVLFSADAPKETGALLLQADGREGLLLGAIVTADGGRVRLSEEAGRPLPRLCPALELCASESLGGKHVEARVTVSADDALTDSVERMRAVYEEQLRRQAKDAELLRMAYQKKDRELQDVLNAKWWRAAKPLRRAIFLARYVVEHARKIGKTGKPVDDAPPSDAIPPSPLLPLLDDPASRVYLREEIDRMLAEQKAWRILLAAPDLAEGGMGEALLRLGEGLRGFGHDVLLAAQADGPVRARAEQAGIPVVVAPGLLTRRDWLGIASPFNLAMLGGLPCVSAVSALNSRDIPVLWWLNEGKGAYDPQWLLAAPETLSEDVRVFAADEEARRQILSYCPQYRPELLEDTGGAAFAERAHEVISRMITRGDYALADLQAHDWQLEKCVPARPRVSVLIPAYNGEADCERLLSALDRQQGLERLEVVAVDSGSRDGTVACCRRHGAKVIEIPNTMFTHSFARNLAARSASGDILLFMTQDAAPTSDTWVSELIAPILRQEATAVSPAEEPPEGTDLYYVISSRVHRHYCGTDTANQLHFGLANGAPDALHRWGALNDVSTAIRRDVFMRYLYRYDFGEDLDMGLRLLRGGCRVALLKDVTVRHGHNRAAGYYVKRSLVGSVTMQEKIQHIQTAGTLPEKVVAALLAEAYGAMQLLGARMSGMVCGREEFQQRIGACLDELGRLSARELIEAPPCPAMQDALIDETIANVRAEIHDKPRKIGLSVHFIRQYLQYVFWPNFDACAEWDDRTSPDLVLQCLNKHFATLIGAELGCIGSDTRLSQRIRPLWRGV